MTNIYDEMPMKCNKCGSKFIGVNTPCPTCKPEVGLSDLSSKQAKESWATANSGAMREKLHDSPYDLVPYQEITEAYCRVAEKGAIKYSPWNWSKGLSRVQLIGSMLRHTFAYLRGQERDPETDLLHTDHILWNAVALCHNVHWNLEDGRRKEPERDYKTIGGE